MSNLAIINATIVTPTGHSARKGDEMAHLRIIKEGAIHIADGLIT